MRYIVIIAVLFLCQVGYGETYESIFTETREENERAYSGVDRLAADSGLHSAMIKLLLQQLAELKAVNKSQQETLASGLRIIKMFGEDINSLKAEVEKLKTSPPMVSARSCVTSPRHLNAEVAELRKGRSYTVKEIDELREACNRRWWYGTTKFGNGHGRTTIMGSGEEDIGTEELVRTYMLGGITAKDIYKEDETK